jgi:hypothetical protein
VQVTGLSGVTQITAGQTFSLALDSNGVAWSWGWDPALGIGPTTAADGPIYGKATPVPVAIITEVTAISANGQHSLALGPYGRVDTTTLSVANVTAHPGDTVQLSATLTRSTGGAPLPGRWLIFTLGKNTLGMAKTDASGTASGGYKIPLSYPAPGSQTITVKFGGDPDYEVSTGTGTLTIKVGSALTLTVSPSGPQYSQNVTATSKLTSGTSVLVGKPVHFYLDGVELAGSPVNTDSAGKAVLVFPAPHPGTYQVTSSFAASSPYPAANAGPVTITVKKATTKLTGETKSAPAGSTVNIGAVLTRTFDGAPLAGRTVSFKVGASTVNATTDASGRASINVTAPAAGGTVTYAVKYAGDADYNASSGSAKVTGT